MLDDIIHIAVGQIGMTADIESRVIEPGGNRKFVVEIAENLAVNRLIYQRQQIARFDAVIFQILNQIVAPDFRV